MFLSIQYAAGHSLMIKYIEKMLESISKYAVNQHSKKYNTFKLFH